MSWLLVFVPIAIGLEWFAPVLRAGLHDVVKASLVGSIVGNILLVLGAVYVILGLPYFFLPAAS
jgi:Ca2+/H+ antiporter